MNAYTLMQCPYCDKVIELGGEDTLTVMVHGAKNVQEITDRIKKGEPMFRIAPDFCGNCGGKLPCGCNDPQAQRAGI